MHFLGLTKCFSPCGIRIFKTNIVNSRIKTTPFWGEMGKRLHEEVIKHKAGKNLNRDFFLSLQITHNIEQNCPLCSAQWVFIKNACHSMLCIEQICGESDGI